MSIYAIMRRPSGRYKRRTSRLHGRSAMLCCPDTPRSVVNELRDAERQAAGRAFAAEFLAPVQSVLDLVGSGRDDYEIASSFMVSPQVVACQIESQDRIREACAWDP